MREKTNTTPRRGPRRGDADTGTPRKLIPPAVKSNVGRATLRRAVKVVQAAAEAA